jgi:hypothetical protein
VENCNEEIKRYQFFNRSRVSWRGQGVFNDESGRIYTTSMVSAFKHSGEVARRGVIYAAAEYPKGDTAFSILS